MKWTLKRNLKAVVPIGLLWLAGAYAGCEPASAQGQSAPAAVQPDPWPAHVAAKIVQVDAPRGLSGLRYEGLFQPPPTDAERQQVEEVVGAERMARVRFEGDGSFVFRPRPGKAAGDGASCFVYISASERGEHLAIERTWFTYYPASGAARGTALLMPGLFGTPLSTLELFTKRLHEQGWAVVRMMSQPSRFTERVMYDVDLGEINAAAARIAQDTCDRAAECGLAAQAAMDRIVGTHPELAKLPRIAVGMSGGAMTLPTVVAREPDKYAAAVIIAGGCDFFAIARETNYVFLVDSVHFHWSPSEPDPEQVRALDAAYLERAKLDSYFTAESLRGKPVLMLHADHDGAVPAHLGDLLWERLGKPERWVQTAGHEELFIKLPEQMDAIMAWIDTHAKATAGGR
jgi:hypothetical protein